ncbi:MAG: stage II sporulation protein P [Clostridia bacterium]|nr:stage II sporulation protein P [Clostridia bacterium]
MEEKQLKAAEDMTDLIRERIERIEPDEIPERRRISIYFLLTISTCIFVIAFAFADFGLKIFKNSAEQLPSVLLGEIFGENERIDLSFSEYISGRLLGVRKFETSELPTFNNDSDADEHLQNEEKTPEKEPLTADTEHETEGQTESPRETEEPPTEDFVKYPIIEMDLSQNRLGEYYIGNETGYDPDIKELLKSEDSIPVFAEADSDLPIVLIIHTHGTESYMEEGKSYYADDGSDISRTEDTDKNVVHIGSLMADILNSEGINTLHCEIMHDKDSYQDSYTRAAETIREYLAKYPSIKYVFDVHRDAILKSDGSLVSAVTEIDGESVAQVMTVVGSNYKGANFPDWEKHLSLALKLKSKLDESYESLSRPVYLRGAAYNQQYTPGSLLLEIGTSGNTLAEAERAGEIVAKALAELIKSS